MAALNKDLSQSHIFFVMGSLEVKPRLAKYITEIHKYSEIFGFFEIHKHSYKES